VVPAPLITAVLCAVAVTAAVTAAPSSVRAPLAWGAVAGSLLLCAAVAVAAHGRQSVRLLRRRLQAAGVDTTRLLQERARAEEDHRQEHERLMGELSRSRARSAAEADRERARLAREHTADLDQLVRDNSRLAAELRRAASERAAALSATANAAGRMQALSTGMLADLRAMEERHGDEDVLADLLHLDHRTAQAGRLADSVAVLTGARSGRRWARPIGMESILRGAMGRINGYQRVRVHSASEAAVTGHAAEGVMHALAELLDNAANFSPPTAEVHVYVEEVPAGVIVSVEDSGLVMGDVQLRRAEQAVAGDAAELGGLTGTRLGLAVVGRLARKYGLKVSYRPSARGGTGVLMLVPQDILTSASGEPALPPAPAAADTTAPAGASRRTRTAAPRTGTDPDPVPAHESAEHGSANGELTGREQERPVPAARAEHGEVPGNLPKRSRGRTLAEAERSRGGAARAAAVPRQAPAEEVRTRTARFSSFRQAVRAVAPDRDHTPPHGIPVVGTPDTASTDAASTDSASTDTGAQDDSTPTRRLRTVPADPAAAPAPETAQDGGPAHEQGPATATSSSSTPYAYPEGDTTS
jgi:signal transduction histidine kinase